MVCFLYVIEMEMLVLKTFMPGLVDIWVTRTEKKNACAEI